MRESKEIQGNPTLIIGGFRSETVEAQANPNEPRIYSDADAVFAFVSLRWRLKSLIEAN